jgi:hypothetical protein
MDNITSWVDDGSCIKLWSGICGGNGFCAGNGTCVCFSGYTQSLEMHYNGAYAAVSTAPCSDGDVINAVLWAICVIYSVGLTFQTSIIRTSQQLVRTLPVIIGYSLVLFPSVVRLALPAQDIGLMSSVPYTFCIATAVGSFGGGVGVL